MRGLSPRQRDVLDFVMAHIDMMGIPPSTREIGVALGIDSTNAVCDHVRRLIGKGYLEQVGGPGSVRSLRPTHKARQHACESVVDVTMVTKLSGLSRLSGRR